jgi:hypothetical protein
MQQQGRQRWFFYTVMLLGIAACLYCSYWQYGRYQLRRRNLPAAPLTQAQQLAPYRHLCYAIQWLCFAGMGCYYIRLLQRS